VIRLLDGEEEQHRQAAEEGRSVISVRRWCPFCRDDRTVDLKVQALPSSPTAPSEAHSRPRWDLPREIVPFAGDQEIPLRRPESLLREQPWERVDRLSQERVPVIERLEMPPREQAVRLLALARGQRAAGHLPEAFHSYRRSAEAAQQAGADRDRALILTEWARILLEHGGDPEEAAKHLEEALTLLGDDRGPRYEEALTLRQRALEGSAVSREAGYVRRET
jgi:tetratricopeptide (TPR) repeat protein